tara:strand:+ start:734 stop:1072 length:339 start_codon:yes stop_codon:yes gene_type:complete
MDILGDFISLLNSEDSNVDIRDLFKDETELNNWKKLVEVFDCIQIDNIVDGLNEVHGKYKLNRDEQILILAYVKFLELMVGRVDVAKEILDKKIDNTNTPTKHKPYTGSMYG